MALGKNLSILFAFVAQEKESTFLRLFAIPQAK